MLWLAGAKVKVLLDVQDALVIDLLFDEKIDHLEEGDGR
jgi:hypothetical protein